MAKANPLQTNFTSGEVSPLLRGRSDVDKYRNGAAEIYNGIVRTQGGVWRRPGTRYLADISSNGKSFIYPFEFSDGQSYIVEFGAGFGQSANKTTIKVMYSDEFLLGQDRVTIPAPTGAWSTISTITSSASKFRITTDDATTISDNDTVIVQGVIGDYSDVNGEWTGAQVDQISTTVIDIDTGSAPSGSYSGGGWISKVTMKIVGPWTETERFQLTFAQSADKLYIAHPNHQTRVLNRVSANRFELSLYDPKDGPYLSGNQTIKSQKIDRIYDATQIGVRVPQHGFSTGDEITIRDSESTTNADGDWTITVTDANNFTLDGSTYASARPGGWVDFDVKLTMSALTDRATLIDEGPASPALLTDTATDAGKHVEVKWRGVWSLFEIVTVTSTTEAEVDYVENAIYRLDPSVELKKKVKNQPFTQTAGALSSNVSMNKSGAGPVILAPNFTGVFSQNDKNKWIRWTQDTDAATAVGPTDGETSANWYSIDNVNYHGGVDKLRTTIIPSADALDWDGTTADWSVGERTVTCTITSNIAFFESTDVGRWIRLNYKGIWVRGKITAQASSTSVTVEIDWEFQEVPNDPEDPDTIMNEGVADTFDMGAWSDTTGWPGVVVFHEQRLCFARTDTEPQNVWMSVSGDFANMEPTESDGTVLDDSAITYTIASRKVNPINWMQSNKTLLIGTDGGEWQARAASSISEPITPSNLSVTPQTNKGSLRYAYPQQVNTGVLFIQSAGQKIYDLLYSFDVDQWQANDVTIISEHILRKGTKAMQTAYQEEPVSILWVLLSNGALAGLTFDRSQNVAAWHYHELGGTDTIIESIAVTRDPTGTKDSLYLAVSREINGGTERFIEKLDPFYYPTSASDKTNLFYVDAGITVTQTSSTTVSGLDHLEGETVDVLANGVDVGPKTVSSGSITLTDAATTIQVGLPYTTRIETLPMEGGSPYGTSQGRRNAIPRMSARFYLTQNVEVGDSSSNTVTQNLNDTSTLFTGTEDFEVNHDYGNEAVLVIAQTAPLPLVVLAVYPQQWSNE